MKDVRSQGIVQCGYFAAREEGVLPMRTSIFLVQKLSGFSKFMMCPHGQGGFSQCGHFSDKGEGSIFRDFVWTSFMNGP